MKAISRSSEAVAGLEMADFGVTLGRNPVDLCAVTHRREPLSLGIVIDSSGSRRSYEKEFWFALSELIKQVRGAASGDEYFVSTIYQDVRTESDWVRDPGALLSSTPGQGRGRSMLLDAAEGAIGKMRTARNANRAILFISDGRENASEANPGRIERALEKAPVPLFFVIPFNFHAERRLREEVHEERGTMLALAERSGGAVGLHATEKSLRTAVEGFIGAMRSPYYLHFLAMADSIQRLKVKARAGGKAPVLVYRGAYRMSGR